MGHRAHFSPQWAHFGRVNAVLYAATEDGKTAEPQPSTSGYRKKNQQDSQEKNTKVKKRELIQEKNSATDDAMFVLF